MLLLYVPVHSTSPRVQPSQETVLLAMPPAFRNLPEKDFHGGRHIPKKVRRRHRGHSRSFGAVGLVGGEAPRDGHGDDLPDAFGNELASMVPAHTYATLGVSSDPRLRPRGTTARRPLSARSRWHSCASRSQPEVLSLVARS